MADISLITGDIEFQNGDFKLTASILNQVLLALFVDGRAPDSLNIEDDVRGYWGSVPEGRHLGSLLWTLHREKITAETIASARDFCIDATRHLIEDGLADEIAYNFSRDTTDPNQLNLEIVVYKDNLVSETLLVNNIYKTSI